MNRFVAISLSVVAVAETLLAHCPASGAESVVAASPASGLVIVPFAVPVAVPVAVVQQPTLFYGVSAYAPPAVSTAASSTKPTSHIGASSPMSPVDDPLRSEVMPLLQRRCAECHRSGQAQGNLTLFDVDGRLLEKLPRQLVVEQATSIDGKPPPMPPGDRAPLSLDEQTLVRRWATVPKRLSY